MLRNVRRERVGTQAWVTDRSQSRLRGIAICRRQRTDIRRKRGTASCVILFDCHRFTLMLSARPVDFLDKMWDCLALKHNCKSIHPLNCEKPNYIKQP